MICCLLTGGKPITVTTLPMGTSIATAGGHPVQTVTMSPAAKPVVNVVSAAGMCS